MKVGNKQDYNYWQNQRWENQKKENEKKKKENVKKKKDKENKEKNNQIKVQLKKKNKQKIYTFVFDVNPTNKKLGVLKEGQDTVEWFKSNNVSLNKEGKGKKAFYRIRLSDNTFADIAKNGELQTTKDAVWWKQVDVTDLALIVSVSDEVEELRTKNSKRVHAKSSQSGRKSFVSSESEEEASSCSESDEEEDSTHQKHPVAAKPKKSSPAKKRTTNTKKASGKTCKLDTIIPHTDETTGEYVILKVPRGSHSFTGLVLPQNQVYQPHEENNIIKYWKPIYHTKKNYPFEEEKDQLNNKLSEIDVTNDTKVTLPKSTGIYFWYQLLHSMQLGGTYWENTKKGKRLKKLVGKHMMDKKGNITLRKKNLGSNLCYDIKGGNDLKKILDSQTFTLPPKK